MKLTRRHTLYALGLSGLSLSGIKAAADRPGDKTESPADYLIFNSADIHISDLQKLGLIGTKDAFDLDVQDVRLWTDLRRPLPRGASVIGLTKWSDYVMARGILQEQRKRMIRERKITRRGKPDLFLWEMT